MGDLNEGLEGSKGCAGCNGKYIKMTENPIQERIKKLVKNPEKKKNQKYNT